MGEPLDPRRFAREYTVEPRNSPSRRVTYESLKKWLDVDVLAQAAYRSGMAEDEFIQVLMEDRARLMGDLAECLSRHPRPFTFPVNRLREDAERLRGGGSDG